ncbi:glycoside hydrolase family 38 C-terminal domain-containing protein [Streptomyces sp. DSM 44915]|uniref:Glycoside hydrolase family 38 C-terminal domain-containing protein n=1 Tax=Streptomyces chisholmiae TaxID=3075540 RepID=A0ABU2JN44_9ACTN|nr:glycoside hydrolase family 38 C-terminal domain-containing protein [Streptomyces sp. DSM 44915]MDT0266166.1 glycoside hydrolase family 38 C-terminal domain-containing protein [Streptomyces sp. DSM 44915]
MHDDRDLVEQRLRRVLDERIRPAVYGAAVPLTPERWDAPGEPVPVAEALAAPYRPAEVGERWGPAWGTSWFRLTGRVPAEWAGLRVEARVDLGFDRRLAGFQCEGLVHRPDGTVVKGLHPQNDWVPVARAARGGEEVAFLVEAAANPTLAEPRPTVLGDRLTAPEEPLYRLVRAELAVFEAEVWELVADLEVVGSLLAELSTDDARRFELVRAVEAALDAVDLADVAGSAPAARAQLAGVLSAPAHASAHRLSAVGHAHIDSAWLWPLRETVRKVARTTANVVALLEESDELVFAMSQAQQLDWLKEHRPELFERVRRRIAEGGFVPVGGMWVESDTNMVGGEAMARQFVYGKRFFLEEFGIETEEVWLPDSFGYTAALPQLVKLSGSRWFLTQKISWSRTNAFPHHTFWWEGIDGTRVFTHFPPIDTYNSDLSGRELAHAARNYREKGRGTRSLVPFGFGDGGGGPTREMLARARRTRDLEGSPRVAIERPAEFFAKAHEEYPHAPVWVGELYLELHRGTYTSQAKTKQGNRHSESLLREAELWAATAALRVPGYAYPYAELERIWKTVLLHQFHDILPGSSIAWVHREARETYARLRAELLGLVDAAQRALTGPGQDTVVFNAAPHERDGVPAGGAARRPAGARPPVAVTERADGGYLLDNGLLRVAVDGRGLLVSAVDLASGREAVAPGLAGNLLQLHPDFPNAWDAWDLDEFYRNRVRDLVAVESLELVEPDAGDEGAATVRVTRAFGASRVVQLVVLRPGARVVEFDTHLDWRESEQVLKAAFPLDVKADESAAETQFGHVNRPTHTNTSWEAAKFEICAHRWLRVAEPGYGVAVVNDSTYGHDVTRDVRPDGGQTTTVRLSLLRAPRYPDPETDQGEHRLRFGLVPGAELADAVREGHRINLPERAVPGGAEVAPLVEVVEPGGEGSLVVSAVKLADDGGGDLVVRLYESGGRRATGRLRVDLPLVGVAVTDLLERPLADEPALEVTEGSVAVSLRPFQILTLRLSHRG